MSIFFYLKRDNHRQSLQRNRMKGCVGTGYPLWLVRDLNPRPLAPKARIIPLDQRAVLLSLNSYILNSVINLFNRN